MTKLVPLAALAAFAALALPVAGWADDGTPMQSQGSGARLARIQDRIQKVEARIDAASQKIAALQQKLADKCSAQTAPVPATGTDQGTAPNRADRCARAQTRLEKAQERLQKAKDRLARVEARIQQWLQNHNGENGSPGLSAADQAALAQLQQQLAGLQS